LYKTINTPEEREWVKDLMSKGEEGLSFKASDIADAVAYAISTPETVAVSEILIRPTKQVVEWMQLLKKRLLVLQGICHKYRK
jgi:NADP-dependent 3-hydroxy acid dehydrogenase YdfG